MSTAVALLLLLVPLSGHGNDAVVQHLDGSARVSLTAGAGEAAQPTWSPDGSHVAFVRAGTIYVVEPDGRNLHAVATGTEPTWSPDSSRLAYLNGSFAVTDVWTVTADGGMPRRLTTDAGDKRALAWSPTGSTILYALLNGGGAGIVALDPVTGGTRRLVSATYFSGEPVGVWSPDGSRIAYADDRVRLSVMSADGSARGVLDMQHTVGAPSWSPDGATLAFAAARVVAGPTSRYGPPMATDVWTVDVGTGRSRRLTGPSDDLSTLASAYVQSYRPRWWPDGSRLFFGRLAYLGPPAWQMNADGTCELPLATPVATPPLPAWQPARGMVAGTVACADLRVRIVGLPGPIALRASGGSSVVVENDGDLAATNVHVRISPKQGSPRVALTGCAGTVCDLGTLQPGDVRRLQAVIGAVGRAGTITATITASGNEDDPTPADASVPTGLEVANCTIAGSWGADVLTGTPRRDRICGFPGADRINGGKGDDYLDAGNGDDTIVGGDGRDTIIARGGRDVIEARDGRLDWIDCGTEHDIAIVDRLDHTHHCEKVVRQ